MSGFQTTSRPTTRERGSDDSLPSLAFLPCCVRACSAITQPSEAASGEQMTPLGARRACEPAPPLPGKRRPPREGGCSAERRLYWAGPSQRACAVASLRPALRPRDCFSHAHRDSPMGTIFTPCSVFTPYLLIMVLWKWFDSSTSATCWKRFAWIFFPVSTTSVKRRKSSRLLSTCNTLGASAGVLSIAPRSSLGWLRV